MKKLPLSAEQEEWFLAQTANAAHVNPCVRLYGLAEPAAKCKDCVLFIRKGGCSKVYFKCKLRGITSGPATDHRANWPACKRFVAVVPNVMPAAAAS